MSEFRLLQPMASTFEQLTVNGVTVLTASKYKSESLTNHRSQHARRALITVEVDQIRWTCDGTVPTAAIGHRANVDDVVIIEGLDGIRLFQAIKITTNATISVSYFGG